MLSLPGKIRWALGGCDSPGARLAVLWRLAAWEILCALRWHPVVRAGELRARFRCHGGDGGARLLYYFREIEEDFQRLCRRFRGRPLTALDAGAHIGTCCIPLALAAGPASRILAVEPQPLAARRLAENAALNGVTARIELIPCCLGAAPGTAEFLIHARDTSRSKQMPPGGESAAGAQRLSVPVRTVDDLCAGAGIARLDLLKVDVEGHELAVLRGARRLLEAKAIGLVCFESNDAAAGQFLADMGYTVSESPPFDAGRLRRTPCAARNLWAVPAISGQSSVIGER